MLTDSRLIAESVGRMKWRAGTWWVAAGVAAGVVFGPGAVEWVALSMKQRRLARRVEALSIRPQQLQEERARLESDDAYVEGLIRSTFKVARRGEYVVPLSEEPPRKAAE